MTRVIKAALLMTMVGLVLLSIPGAALKPQSAGSAPQIDNPRGWPESKRSESNTADLQKRQAREANKQRQLELKRDSERLLQLATELKLQVDKSNEHVLSLDVMRKAEQIEKLAHSVRERMKGNP